MADTLDARNCVARQQVLVSALEAVKCGRVETISQVQADWPHRCTVANSETHRVLHVVKVGHVALFVAKRNAAQVRVDVAQIVEEHASDVVAQKGKAEFGGMEEERVSSEREARLQVPGAGLIVGKAAMRARSSTEKAFWQRHILSGIITPAILNGRIQPNWVLLASTRSP